jgi:ribose/xylose/arabinose/galactoside ABC-type transport system permease subunit
MSTLWRRAGRPEFVVNNILVMALIVMCAFFATQSDRFLSFGNFELMMTNDAPIGALCAVLALLVIAGHVDLSVGSNIGFAGVLTALAVTQWGYSDGVALAIGILAGAGAGAINGLLCAILRFNPIIVTLGMLAVLRGVTLLIEETEQYGLGGTFRTIANGEVIGLPVLLLIALSAFVLAALFISLTPWGRHIYAIGVNPQAAFLAALPVRALPFALYVATGAAAGLAGALITARLDGASPGQQGLQMELQALTIILLGGVAFTGGRGRIFGVFTAWVFLAALQNGLVLMNVTPFVQLVASGMALVFAAALDQLGAVIGPRLQERRRVALQSAAAQRADASPNSASVPGASVEAGP